MTHRTPRQGVPLAFRFWSEECVVYDRRSGDTHLLPALHAGVLQWILEGTEHAELADRLVTEYGMDPQAAAGLCSRLVADYTDLGLIES